MLKTLKRIVPSRVKRALRELRDERLGGHGVRSYSQEGEDMILRRIFEDCATGFYVDVGAHHPFRFSNTCHFHRRGWRGINIDAMPGSMAAFRRHRPADINLETPVGDRDEVLTYYVFDEPALNGFSRELSAERAAAGTYRITAEIPLRTRRLSEILDEHLPAGTAIDFLSVDVEGHDLAVLRSNDWEKYRPRVVLVEILGNRFSDIEGHEISALLRGHGYRPFAKAVYTVLFIQESLYAARFSK